MTPNSHIAIRSCILHRKRISFLAFIFFSLSFGCGYGQTTKQWDSIRTIFERTRYHHPDSAFHVLERGISLARKDNDSLKLAILYRYKGVLYKPKSQKLALENYYEARRIFKSVHSEQGVIHACLGLSEASTEIEQKIRFAQEANTISRSIKDTLLMIYTLNALGTALSESEDGRDSGLYYLGLGLQLARKTGDSICTAMTYNNIGNIQSDRGEYKKALQSYSNSLSLSQNTDHILGTQANLMSVYLHFDQPDSSQHYYNIIKDHFERRPFLERAYYENFAEYYARIGQGIKAYTFLKKADSIKDVLAREKDASALGLLELEYESRLKEEQMARLHADIQKADYIRYLLTGIVLILLVAGSTIFYQYKQRSRKEKEAILHKKRRAETERKLISEKLQYIEVKNQYLNSQLKYTNNELAYIAAGNVKNGELLFELKDRIENTYKKDDLKTIKNSLRELNIQLLQLINKDQEERKKLVDKAKDVNTALISGLKEKFSNLSNSDIRLLILLLLKFNSKDIAMMYNIEERSVVIRRYRLRKKLNVGKYESFEDFLERILPDISLLDHSVVNT